MRESIGYTATLRIFIIFFTAMFAFIFMAISYFKANKINKIVTASIEKYEGYNTLSEQEILDNIKKIGYNSTSVNCADSRGGCDLLTQQSYSTGQKGYCVYLCETDKNLYYYKISTNSLMSIPIIHDLLYIPIYNDTNKLFDFEKILGGN